MHVRTCTYLQIRALIRLVAAATIRERRLFRSALAQVRLLFESGVYSREVSIRSYTVARNTNKNSKEIQKSREIKPNEKKFTSGVNDYLPGLQVTYKSYEMLRIANLSWPL